MAQTKREIEALLTEAGVGPRHRWGQNFMIDANLVRRVADAGRIDPVDRVIEIGPGTGTLTEELLQRGGEVLAVEIDPHLAGMLRRRFGDRERFRLIEADALSGKHQLNDELSGYVAARPNAGAGATKLVANLPYNIASPLVIELLIAGVELLAFTVQKEVAQRLRADAGEEAYGPLSVMAQTLSRVELLRTLPPQAFWPAPKVESALVRLTRDDRLGAVAQAGVGAGAFGRLVHQLFSARRKTLRRALTQADYPADEVISELRLDPRQRPETLSPEQFVQIFRLAAGFRS